MRPGTRILLVEDDRAIAGFVEPELEHLGFLVRCAYDGLTGLEEAERFGPALIVLDIMLPGLDGVGVLRRLREGGNGVPVIMLTARDTTLDKVHSLDRGADDYLTKPFDIEELLARIRALLRRVEGEEILRVADLEINTSTREVRREEREIELTTREYELLAFMARILAGCSPAISCSRASGTGSWASPPTWWMSTSATSGERWTPLVRRS